MEFHLYFEDDHYSHIWKFINDSSNTHPHIFLIIINGKTEINKHKLAKLSIRFESNPLGSNPLISETEKSDAKINI